MVRLTRHIPPNPSGIADTWRGDLGPSFEQVPKRCFGQVPLVAVLGSVLHGISRLLSPAVRKRLTVGKRHQFSGVHRVIQKLGSSLR